MGPILQSDSFSILLRFQLPRIILTIDVHKMYRQMLIQPNDRKFQLIAWKNNAIDSLKYYDLNTLTDRTRPALYLATKCLQQSG